MQASIRSKLKFIQIRLKIIQLQQYLRCWVEHKSPKGGLFQKISEKINKNSGHYIRLDVLPI